MDVVGHLFSPWRVLGRRFENCRRPCHAALRGEHGFEAWACGWMRTNGQVAIGIEFAFVVGEEPEHDERVPPPPTAL